VPARPPRSASRPASARNRMRLGHAGDRGGSGPRRAGDGRHALARAKGFCRGPYRRCRTRRSHRDKARRLSRDRRPLRRGRERRNGRSRRPGILARIRHGD
jgi:hypothetical protein